MNIPYPIQLLNQWDQTLCIRVNRASRNRFMRAGFGAISELGDGVFWYGLMLAMLLAFRAEAVPAVMHMIVTGLVCTTLYKLLKRKTARPAGRGTA